MSDADPTDALEVYVWFEADPADDARVRAAEGRLAEAMALGGAEPVVDRPRLLRRPDLKHRDGAPRATWMEVWPAVPRHELAVWLARLEDTAASVGVAALVRGGRHAEPFQAMPPQR